MRFEVYRNAIRVMRANIVPLALRYNVSKMYIWLDALKAYIWYGVTPREYIMFEFYKKSALERKEYYTARMEKKIFPKLNDLSNADVFNDKVLFNTKFHQWIKREWLFCKDANLNEIELFLTKHKKVIVKPVAQSSGRGIYVHQDEPASHFVGREILLEEFLTQDPAMERCNATSVNTVRIYTILDYSKTPHILCATLRVGTPGSVVDNSHAGGVAYPVDIHTGVVSGQGLAANGERCICHPGTNHVLVGFHIPHWEKVKYKVCLAAQVEPTIRYVGWDVAITPDGIALIEGNHDANLDVMQGPSSCGQLKKIKEYI